MRPLRFSRSPLLDQSLPPWRQRFVLGLLLLGFGTLVGRSLYLQGIRNDFLGDQGRARYERVIDNSATRGRITDRQGNMLAVSTPVKSLWAIPEDAQLTPAQLRDLAKSLDMDARELTRKLASERDFVFVKRQLPPELAERIAGMKLPGLHLQNEYRRYYPSGETTAHMLGFTGIDDTGQEGIELAFNTDLTGQAGSRRVIKDRRGNIIEDVESVKPPREGKDVALALDDKIQYLAYSALKKAVTVNNAMAGSVVVLDVRTGEVLALANLPTYNPNNRTKLAGAQLRNRVITDTFEPGSTMKPFIAAMALDSGRVRFDTPINTAPGKMTIGSATISDAHPHGTLSVAEVIQKSSNIGVAKLALSMKADDIWGTLQTLGFGHPIKLGFPGESAGRVRAAKTWKPIEQATMAYGHGLSVTLMHMARAYQVFARDGDLLPISLTRVDAPSQSGTQIFSPKTAGEVRTMLEMAVKPGGTAPQAQISGYRVAGKTGTAHKIEAGGYVNKYVSSFVGFAPVSDPRFIVAVMIDEPSAGKYYGGAVAAPVFAEIMASSLRAHGVPTDAPLKPLIMANAPSTPEEM
ncbi:MAG: penicillin-binding protein 2 [Rhodocyclaceae bacterium]|nr:penicillin-binding protein 2 [Rhodocyclaceae bacterium]